MNDAQAPRRVAVYGEIDLNLVDGSAVWVHSICQVLAASAPGTEVTLLLRRSMAPERRFLLAELEANPAVHLVDPGRPGRLQPDDALDLLAELDAERGPFDLVLLRGAAVLAAAAGRKEFEGRLWPYVIGDGLPSEQLRALMRRSHRVLCQTEAVAEELRAIEPRAGRSLLVLPPMIPATDVPPAAGEGEGTLRLVYAGKLAPEYCWLETVEAFAALRAERPDPVELVVIGDKIHRPPEQPLFHDEALRTLRETEGLRWQGAVPRHEVHELLAGCDLALSVRDPGVEGSREISTKVLEYGAAGLPVVLSRAPVYERLLGDDYPLFVDAPGDAPALLVGPALDPAVRAAAAAACHAASRDFTFPRVGARLAADLPPPSPRRRAPGRSGARVLVAGHDFKFLAPIRSAVSSAGAELAEDPWDNHSEHSESASRAALAPADVVLCEWCLGNAAWYSRNVADEQRLVVRLHRMEIETGHPGRVDMDRVDSVAFVAEHVLEQAVARFGWDRERLRVIPNAIDCARLRRPKSEDARFTLALIGYVPQLKRFDRALDVLEELRRREPRFRLVVVGRPPSDFGWVVKREEEVAAFRRSYARIQESDLLRGSVELLPFTVDLPSLFERVGWILSTSDFEGHQVTLAEGAASGAVPVVLDRDGIADQYPGRWIHATPAEAAAAVAASPAEQLDAERTAAATHAARWSLDRIRPLWLDALGLDGPLGAGGQAEPLDRVAGELQA
jgi:glycosyltransferase involved in cell wall biosynthesis